MARLARPLWQLPFLQHLSCRVDCIHKHTSLLLREQISQHFPYGMLLSVQICSHGNLSRVHALTPSNVVEEEGSDLDSEARKSRNQKKREARRAVRWGVELASFSPNQIKRILKITSLEQDVFDALMLVKRFGPDIREGKRRQFNYIGKLLREVQPDLMDALILSTKDGNWNRMNNFLDANVEDVEDDGEFDELVEDEESSHAYVERANRWLEGIINGDVQITKEIYALQSIDFDRKELRRLVRMAQEVQQRIVKGENEQEIGSALCSSRKSLTRFLLHLARHSNSESSVDHM